MQKLLTVYLDNDAYGKGQRVFGMHGDKHGLIEEHLSEYLAVDWRVVSVSGFGGADDLHFKGWLVVLLENDEA